MESQSNHEVKTGVLTPDSLETYNSLLIYYGFPPVKDGEEVTIIFVDSPVMEYQRRSNRLFEAAEFV